MLLASLRQPAHHAAQLRADDFDGMLLLFLTQLVEVRAARLVFRNPLLRELAGLDVGQHLLHRLPRGVADNLLAASQVAILGGVRDRVAHAVQSTFVDQVDDQLHFVQALEVGDLRRVPGFDQSLESLLDQRRQAAAKNCLLAEQIALGFFFEGCLQNAGAG